MHAKDSIIKNNARTTQSEHKRALYPTPSSSKSSDSGRCSFRNDARAFIEGMMCRLLPHKRWQVHRNHKRYKAIATENAHKRAFSPSPSSPKSSDNGKCNFRNDARAFIDGVRSMLDNGASAS